MTPKSLRDKTYQALKSSLAMMNDPEWRRSVKAMSDAERANEARNKIKISDALTEFETSALGSLRDNLINNEEQLKAAIEDVNKARKELEGVAENLRALDTLLGILGGFISFVAL